MTTATNDPSRSRGATIDVDIGGTFTDCFVRVADGRMAATKTPTTGYRLAVGFMRALKTAAGELGLEVSDLLSATEAVGEKGACGRFGRRHLRWTAPYTGDSCR